MKDYFKFLASTVAAYLVIMWLERHVGGISPFFVAGGLGGLFIKRKRYDQAIGYFLWLVFIMLAFHYIANEVPQYLIDHPEQKIDAHTLEGAAIVFGELSLIPYAMEWVD